MSSSSPTSQALPLQPIARQRSAGYLFGKADRSWLCLFKLVMQGITRTCATSVILETAETVVWIVSPTAKGQVRTLLVCPKYRGLAQRPTMDREPHDSRRANNCAKMLPNAVRELYGAHPPNRLGHSDASVRKYSQQAMKQRRVFFDILPGTLRFTSHCSL